MSTSKNFPQDDALNARWRAFEKRFEAKFQKKPTIETALFIIGVENRFNGQAADKIQKEQFIAEGFHIAFEKRGYFERQSDGSWKELKPIPKLLPDEKDAFFREVILNYFAQ
jgi:hypothetical protein